MSASKRTKAPRDAQWQRVHQLMVAFVNARASGTVTGQLRDELYIALHEAIELLARKIVKKNRGDQALTPISAEVAGRLWKSSGFTELIDDFKPGRGDAFSWFYRILLNQWIDWVRHEQIQCGSLMLAEEEWEPVLNAFAEQLADMPLGDAFGSPPPQPDQVLEQKQESDALYSALATLSDRQQKILRLRHAHDMTAKEVAELLGVSKATVDRELARAVEIVAQIKGKPGP